MVVTGNIWSRKKEIKYLRRDLDFFLITKATTNETVHCLSILSLTTLQTYMTTISIHHTTTVFAGCFAVD